MNIDTKCLHAGYSPKNGEPRAMPIVQSTTFRYESGDLMARLFDLSGEGYFYTRVCNPTNDNVAAKICALEGGAAALLTASGQAANFYALFNICSSGDHIVSSSAIYGGTYNLIGVTMKRMGVECTFVHPDSSYEELEAAFKPNTKALFAESLANPAMIPLDFDKFAKAAKARKVPFIVDNTFPTPINCRPFEFGADIVTHSTTKYMDGHATVVGGAIVDNGSFDWFAVAEKYPGLTEPDDSYHGITYAERFGKAGYVMKAVAQLMRDLGAIPSPMNSFMLNTHLESLPLRMAKHCDNAMKVASFLNTHEAVAWVRYPGLENDPYYDLAQKYMRSGTCGVLSFGLKGSDGDTADDVRARAVKFMDALKLCSIATHVADAKTCVLYPAGTTHRQMSGSQLKEAGVSEDLIRISVGIEDAGDIIEDVERALEL